MIQGFARTALVLYPYWEDYSGRSSSYYNHINKAAENIKKYMNACGIKTVSFITDDAARDIRTTPDIWIQTLGSGDMFFAKQYCAGMDVDFHNVEVKKEVSQEMLKKYPNVKGASVDSRFEMMLKRDTAARRQIMKEYNLLVLFNPTLKYAPKEGSNKLAVVIENSSFIPKTYISDMEENAIDLLGIKNGNMPVYEWEVETIV